MGIAYWITPNYLVLPVTTSHIEMVIDYPMIFAIDAEYIQTVYDGYKEPLRCEGGARAEIIKELVKKGYIRLRRYQKKREYWSANIREADATTLDTLREFFWAMVQGRFGYREKDLYAEVKIDTGKGSSVIILKELLQGFKPDKLRLTLWNPEGMR